MSVRITTDMLTRDNAPVSVCDFMGHPEDMFEGLCELLADERIESAEFDTGKTAEFHGIHVTPGFDHAEVRDMLANSFPEYLQWVAPEVFGDDKPVRVGAIDDCDTYSYRFSVDGNALMAMYLDIMGEPVVEDIRPIAQEIYGCDPARWALAQVISVLLEEFQVGYFEFYDFYCESADTRVAFPEINSFFYE